MLEAEIIGIEVHLPPTVERLAENLRMGGSQRLVDESNLAAYSRYLKKKLRRRFDCNRVAVKRPGAKRKRDLSSYPDLKVLVKARPGLAGPVVFDPAAEGEVELFVKDALLAFEELIRRARRRILLAKVIAGAAALAAIAWALHKAGVL